MSRKNYRVVPGHGPIYHRCQAPHIHCWDIWKRPGRLWENGSALPDRCRLLLGRRIKGQCKPLLTEGSSILRSEWRFLKGMCLYKKSQFCLLINFVYFPSLLKYMSELHIPALNHRCWNILQRSTSFALLYATCVLTRLTAPFQSKSTKMRFLVSPSLVSANLCPHWYRRLKNVTRMALQLLSKTTIPFLHWTAGSVISFYELNRASRAKTTWNELCSTRGKLKLIQKIRIIWICLLKHLLLSIQLQFYFASSSLDTHFISLNIKCVEHVIPRKHLQISKQTFASSYCFWKATICNQTRANLY